jgi:transposase-like protein|tara:strand:+ start:160 stop:1392 length:1233 start_codon:yes stop_codon:yes gene_type:complete
MKGEIMTSHRDIKNELLDELLTDYGDPKDILGKEGLLHQLQKKIVERVLDAELEHHLGYAVNERSDSSNARNGKTRKTIKTDTAQVEIEVPRDRDSSFEPQLVKKRQRRLEGFDDKVLAFYSRGLSTREIQAALEEVYGIEVSPTLISNVTNAVLDEVRAWQSRPLGTVYPILYFDAMFVKSREDGPVKNKAVYLALGVNLEGEKELLGLWMSEHEGSTFWLSVFNELKNRGVEDCFVACVDGLKGLPEAIETVYPRAQVQLCIVHKIRNSLKYVPWKERKEVAKDLRAIYAAATLTEAEQALETFSERWDEHYPAISPSWRADWDRLTVMFDFPPAIRKVIYTTNAIESLNYSMRKILKNRGAFPNDASILKIFYLALRNVAKRWTMPIRDWKSALNQFVILYGDRVPQ